MYQTVNFYDFQREFETMNAELEWFEKGLKNDKSEI